MFPSRVYIGIRVLLYSALAIGVGLLGCESPPEDAPVQVEADAGADATDVDAIDVMGDTGAESTPIGTPVEACPAGEFVAGDWFLGQGLCRAQAPTMTDWDCPQGWSEESGAAGQHADGALPAELSDYRVCGVSGPADGCAAGELALVGQSECVPHGSDCPEAGHLWGQEQSIRQRASGFSGRILYVAADAAPGGAATRSDPVALAEAVSAAENGDIIALSVGDFTEQLTLASDVALVGACVESTIIRPPAQPAEPAITLAQDGEALVADITVDGGQTGVSVADATAITRLQAVRIQRARSSGLSVQAGAGVVSAEQLVVTDTAGDADGAAGYGVHVGAGAQLDLSSAWLAQNRTVGVLVSGEDTDVTLSDTAIVGTRHQEADGGFGAGVVVGQQASLSLERVWVHDNRHTGVMAEGDGTQAALTDVFIEATRGQHGLGKHGFGLTVSRGASAQLRRVRLEENRSVGLAVRGEGTVVDASQVLIRQTQLEAAANDGGLGVQVDDGATVELESVWLDQNHSVGLLGWGEDTQVQLSDTLITRTEADADGALGIGVQIGSGAALDLSRALLHHNRVVGLKAQGSHTSVEVRDIAVTGTRPQAVDDQVGAGVLVHDDAELLVERAWLKGNRSVGLWMHGEDTLARLTDVVVLDTLPQQSDDRFGEGIVMQRDAEIDLERAWLSGNHQLGLAAWGGSHGRCADLVISGTRASAVGYGDGVFLLESSDIEFVRAVVHDNERHGMVVSNAGARLAQSVISANQVGLVRQQQTEVVLQDSRFEGNQQSEEQCQLLCYDEPPESEPVDALPPLD